jgi:hypothetical protein
MPLRKSPSTRSSEIERVAQGWGKVVARRVVAEVRPELGLSAHGIKQVAKDTACVVAKSTMEPLVEKKASLLGPEQACLTCQRPCPVEREPRPIQFRGGEVTYPEPKCHCPTCGRDSFPSASGLPTETP